MKVLVVGSGGREHALCWKIAQSPLLEELLCAPGNPGTSRLARNVDVSAGDLYGIVRLAQSEEVDLVVIGPEDPLCAGLADLLTDAGILCFGPSAKAAEIEGNKAFCKELMERHRIPTAGFTVFSDARWARQELENREVWPVVVKAAGLAAGKGVFICHTVEEGTSALQRLAEGEFGAAGKQIVVEDFLEGEEVSVLLLTDGRTLIPLAPCQDHKRLSDGDQGPNTGGMGAVCPTPALSERGSAQVETQVLVPSVHALASEGRRFRGVLYAGLMLTDSGPRVLEFNARFGDPECQPLLMRMKSDLLPYLRATAKGELEGMDAPEWDDRVAVGVVAAAPGYPEAPVKGAVVEGLDEIAAEEDLEVFQAGTALDGDGRVVVSGGRVLCVTALGADTQEARDRAYAALETVRFEGMHVRTDIAERAL